MTPAEQPAERKNVGALTADDDDRCLSLFQGFYRDEMRRTVAWRTRLDNTTNWAVILVATLLTWAFSREDNPHYVILIGLIGVGCFLAMEAHRYRTYDVWRSRIRLLEENLFAEVLDPGELENRRWRTLLAEDLRRPRLKISFVEALRRRLLRSYLALFLLLLLAWVFRVTTLSQDHASRTILEVAAIWWIPGWVVISLVGAFLLALVSLVALPTSREAKGRLREHDSSNQW